MTDFERPTEDETIEPVPAEPEPEDIADAALLEEKQ